MGGTCHVGRVRTVASGTASRSANHPLTGLAIAAALIAAWLSIHVYGIFFWHWTAASVPLAILLIAVQTWLSTGLFIVAHDAMHGTLAPGRPRLNRMVGTTCLALYASLSFRALLPKHMAHHRHVGSANDPDFNADDPSRILPWFLRFFVGYYTHAQIVRITVMALVYIFAFGAPLGNIVVFWAIPALLALVQLFVFGTYLPHRHEDEPFPDDHRARSTTLSPALSLLSCFHFGGYHHEHHLYPGTPWWQLPSRRR